MTKNSDNKFRSSYRGPKTNGRKGKRKSGGGETIIIAGGVVVVLAVLLAAAAVKGMNGEKPSPTAAASSGSLEEETAAADLTVNGVSLAGMTLQEAKEALSPQFAWNISVGYGDDVYPMDSPIDGWLESQLKTLLAEGATGEQQLDLSSLREGVAAQAAGFASQWDVSPKNGGLDHFDKESGTFVFSDGCGGMVMNQEKLVSDVMAAVEKGTFDAVVQAEFGDAQPELTTEQAKAQYTTLASFTTETTDNPKRNTNVRLAAEAINGTVVQPGEEFSFNAVVGQRTQEKGYEQAAAYNSGEVVQEIGGGVCQVSSTLYRVAFQSGMEITFRRSHTFEPNYVTPGQDAAISWDQPDFRFVNTSPYPIGILASYGNRKTSVSIYGIPVLEAGVTWDLYSEKVEELDPPEPEYIEDAALAPGEEKVQKAGTNGSRWVTYKVISKDGAEVERIEDHSKTYKGHAAVIRRNTGNTAAQTTTAAPTVDGMPDSYVPGQSVPSEEGAGGALETTAADIQTQAAPSQTEAAKETEGSKAASASRETEAPKATSASRETETPKATSAPKETAPKETTAASAPKETTAPAPTAQAPETPASGAPTAAPDQTMQGVPIVPPIS